MVIYIQSCAIFDKSVDSTLVISNMHKLNYFRRHGFYRLDVFSKSEVKGKSDTLYLADMTKIEDLTLYSQIDSVTLLKCDSILIHLSLDDKSGTFICNLEKCSRKWIIGDTLEYVSVLDEQKEYKYNNFNLVCKTIKIKKQEVYYIAFLRNTSDIFNRVLVFSLNRRHLFYRKDKNELRAF